MLMLDAKGSVINPSIARHMMAQLRLKFGDDLEDMGFWAEMHPSQIIEWENCGIPVQYIGFEPNYEFQKTFMRLPLESNAHLSPTVILIRKNRDIVAEIARLGSTSWKTEEVNA